MMAVSEKLLKEALNYAGGKEQFARQYQQYSNSVLFIDEHRLDLLKRHDGEWIAVYYSEVVGNSKKYDVLTRKLIRLKVPIKEVVIKFISSRNVVALF
jgi:hypothetical protein